MDDESSLRQQLCSYAQQLASSGLSQGKSGNLSVRCDDGLLITPSGIAYQQLEAGDMVKLQLDGQPLPRQRYKPSSEWRFHCDIYLQRPDAMAIVHAHPPACTALACTGRAIPAFHYMVAVAGGTHIPLADYALFGSSQLSANVCQALGSLNACLMANHGMLALSSGLEAAFHLAIEVENLAEQYTRALQLGQPIILDEQAMQAVLEQFRAYGSRT